MSHTLDEQSTRLYRIWKTVMEILRDRDYVVAEFELSFTQEQFREKFGDEPKREDLTIQKPSRSNNAEHIFVFFPEEAKVGVKTIKTYVDRMKTETVHRAILVVQQNLTPFARQCVSEMSSKYHLEVFQEAELLVNIEDHVLVPQHEVMTPDETKTLLERDTVKETEGNLPVAPLTRARAVNTGNSKKRKIVHRTSSGRRKDAETKTVPLRKMKAAASLDLSDPSQLTMKEIIRRAEAIERAKAREEAAKKAEEKEKRGASSTTSAAATESPVAQDTPAPSVLTPQVQIVNGRIVINQQSLVVAAQASTREDTDSYRRVEEDRPKLNYNSYANRTPVERWKAEDTDLFYKALQQFGTDFELIQNLFPGRTRRQVKAKFKNEEKLNPVRLADALGHKTQDQSQHYRAIIEMLKTEKPDGENEDDILLERLLLPSVMDGSVATQQTPGTQASSSTDKVDEVVNLEAPANAVVLEKTKPDLRMASASEPMVSIPPESEVATDTGNDDPLASEATGNPLSSYQSNSNSSANPLGSYGKQTNPLGKYGKESLSGNPLGSYAKNPLGVYK